MVNTERLGDALAPFRARRRLPPPAERRRLRERAGLSHRDAAEVLGVHPSTIHYWERGRVNPSKRNALAYAALLDQLAEELGPTDMRRRPSSSRLLLQLQLLNARGGIGSGAPAVGQEPQ